MYWRDWPTLFHFSHDSINEFNCLYQTVCACCPFLEGLIYYIFHLAWGTVMYLAMCQAECMLSFIGKTGPLYFSPHTRALINLPWLCTKLSACCPLLERLVHCTSLLTRRLWWTCHGYVPSWVHVVLYWKDWSIVFLYSQEGFDELAMAMYQAECMLSFTEKTGPLYFSPHTRALMNLPWLCTKLSACCPLLERLVHCTSLLTRRLWSTCHGYVPSWMHVVLYWKDWSTVFLTSHKGFDQLAMAMYQAECMLSFIGKTGPLFFFSSQEGFDQLAMVMYQAECMLSFIGKTGPLYFSPHTSALMNLPWLCIKLSACCPLLKRLAHCISLLTWGLWWTCHGYVPSWVHVVFYWKDWSTVFLSSHEGFDELAMAMFQTKCMLSFIGKTGPLYFSPHTRALIILPWLCIKLSACCPLMERLAHCISLFTWGLWWTCHGYVPSWVHVVFYWKDWSTVFLSSHESFDELAMAMCQAECMLSLIGKTGPLYFSPHTRALMNLPWLYIKLSACCPLLERLVHCTSLLTRGLWSTCHGFVPSWVHVVLNWKDWSTVLLSSHEGFDQLAMVMCQAECMLSFFKKTGPLYFSPHTRALINLPWLCAKLSACCLLLERLVHCISLLTWGLWSTCHGYVPSWMHVVLYWKDWSTVFLSSHEGLDQLAMAMYQAECMLSFIGKTGPLYLSPHTRALSNLPWLYTELSACCPLLERLVHLFLSSHEGFDELARLCTKLSACCPLLERLVHCISPLTRGLWSTCHGYVPSWMHVVLYWKDWSTVFLSSHEGFYQLAMAMYQAEGMLSFIGKTCPLYFSPHTKALMNLPWLYTKLSACCPLSERLVHLFLSSQEGFDQLAMAMYQAECMLSFIGKTGPL